MPYARGKTTNFRNCRGWLSVNHNGNLNTAFELVDVAKEAGVDIFKTQTFWGLPKFEHLELTKDEWVQLKEYCDQVGIEFMSTPDTIEAVGFLAELGMKRWKIGSGNATNHKFLEHIATMDGEFILSTGMCNLEEVEGALESLMGGRLMASITVLQCTTAYLGLWLQWARSSVFPSDFPIIR